MKLLTGIAALVFVAVSLTFTAIPPSVAQSNRQQPKPQVTPQRPQEVGEGDVVRIDTDLVTLTATVMDSRGRYVANLKQNDFAVYEDGVKQELAYFSTGDRVPGLLQHRRSRARKPRHPVRHQREHDRQDRGCERCGRTLR